MTETDEVATCIPVTTGQIGSLDFSYWGGRNYITVHQIIQGYLNLAKSYFGDYEPRDFRMRLKTPILRQCTLLDHTSTSQAAVEFTGVIGKKYFSHHLFSDREPIETQTEEFPPDWKSVLVVSGNSVRLGSPLGLPHSYLMMGMGKVLSGALLGVKNPRVVDYRVASLPRSEEEMKFKLEMIGSLKNGFGRFNILVGSETLGRIIIWTGLG